MWFQNLLWVYGMGWMGVRFPGLKFCSSLALVEFHLYAFTHKTVLIIVFCKKCAGCLLNVFHHVKINVACSVNDTKWRRESSR